MAVFDVQRSSVVDPCMRWQVITTAAHLPAHG